MNLTTTNLKYTAVVLVGIVGEKFLIMDLGELEVRLGATSATAGGLAAKNWEAFGSMAAGRKVVVSNRRKGKGYIGTAWKVVDVGEKGDTETIRPFEPQSVNSHGVDVIRQISDLWRLIKPC